MKCKNCQAGNPDTNKFCGECGERVVAVEVITDEILETKIKLVLQNNFKDRQVVEVETIESVVNRVSAWAKLFGYFVGIPLAIVLFILGFLGYNSYSSFSNLIKDSEQKLKPQIDQAKNKVDQLSGEAKKLETNLNKYKQFDQQIANLTSTVNNEAEKLTANLNKYKQLDQQITDLTSTVNIIAEKVNISGVNNGSKHKIEQNLNAFQKYMQTLGFKPNSNEINILIEKKTNYPVCYFNFEKNTMHISFNYLDEYKLFYREYLHQALFANLDQKQLSQKENKRWYDCIESGLAFYFPCSYNNNSIFSVTDVYPGKDFVFDLSQNLKFITPVSLLDVNGPAGHAWSSVFWELRTKMGKENADKLIYASWAAVSNAIWNNNDPIDFINLLIKNDKKFLSGNNENLIKQTFATRGLTIPENNKLP